MTDNRYVTKLSSAQDSSAISQGVKLRIAFLKLSASAIEDSNLSSDDFQTINEGLLQKGTDQRAYNILRDACDYFNNTPMTELDISYLARTLDSAQTMEQEDEAEALTTAYEALSIEGKAVVQKSILNST